MKNMIVASPLTAKAFARYGDVIEITGKPDKLINQGKCGRYHNLAELDFSDGIAGISIFESEPQQFPYVVDMVERHPFGSQTFIPLNQVPMLIIAAEDANGTPTGPKAFISENGQSVNIRRGTWHGVLAPIGNPGQYVVVDRIGEGMDLEEHRFHMPYIVTHPGL